jgi:O-antigen ligase
MRPRFSLILKYAWTALLNLGFGLLCGRFLFAAGHTGDWSLVMLAAGSFVLGWWNPCASLFALILSFSLVSGLERTVLHVPSSAVLTIASALWLGLTVRSFFPVPSKERACTAPADHPNCANDWITLVVEILAAIALVAMSMQTWSQGAKPDFWTQFWHWTHFGSGDPLYFLTSGFLWLHGLFYFRAIRPNSEILTPASINLVLFVNGIVLLFFHGVQWLFDYPARWNPGFESPYEDIATFGIMAACFLTLCLALIRRGNMSQLFVLLLGALLLTVAVGASWSRGSWLTCATFLVVLAWLRLPRSAVIAVLVTLVGVVIFLNLNAGKMPPTVQVSRLISLVRFENLEGKSAGRFSLYHRAWVMIQERPWTGHGIGVFYRKATSYTKPGDPYAETHHLPHNVLLQLAVEQGVPVALLFVGLVGRTLWCGARGWIIHQSRRAIVKGDSRVPNDPLAHLILGLTLALAAYLQANMTWDILLVHPTQPFFFWFLIAALWATVKRVDAASPSVAATK